MILAETIDDMTEERAKAILLRVATTARAYREEPALGFSNVLVVLDDWSLLEPDTED